MQKYKKYDKTLMDTAKIWSNESYCDRKKVGAVIAQDSRIISTGYNGTISGAENCCENEIIDKVVICSECKGQSFWDREDNGIPFKHCTTCDTKVFEKDFIYKEVPRLVSKNTVVHAEANAIMFAAKNGIKTDGCTLYVTMSPCVECGKMIIQSGIKRVVYSESYRITDGIDFLKEHGVEVINLP
jgi:dCMP deaminase